jgi:hypothetical protein
LGPSKQVIFAAGQWNWTSQSAVTRRDLRQGNTEGILYTFESFTMDIAFFIGDP